MSNKPSGGTRWFALLIAVWMVLIVFVASPAGANDDDEGGGDSSGCHHHDHHGDGHRHGHDNDDCPDGEIPPTTTTTAIPPTTTTPPTTTVPAATTVTTTPPTTTVPAATTVTTTPPTTTTPPVLRPPDPQWMEQRLENWSDPTITTTLNLAGYESKDSLVLAIGLAGSANNDDGPGVGGEGGSHISPREGLTVVFRTAVETIRSQLIFATILGVLIAALTRMGIDKRR